MNTVSSFRVRRTVRPAMALHLFCLGLALLGAFAPLASAAEKPKPSTVHVTLSEWKVSLTPPTIPAGPVLLEVTNSGTIPHALEIEGRGLEQSTSRILPGASARLALDLRAGTYEAYCPIGRGSHKMMGMVSRLTVGDVKHVSEMPGMMHGEEHAMEADPPGGAKSMKLVGGGPVIQILPGPFPFADSAAVVIRDRPPEQQADLTKKSRLGPYSNNVATIAGNISLVAIDRGATGDSVSGVAEFTVADGARWKVVMDRVQTKDIPFNPRFGGVVMGLFYHGASGVHTPLVPTIQSSLALWAFAHLYKNDLLVTDNAMVHVMLLSRTRRPSDWALDCWDCTDRPIEELQLQVTSAPDTPAISAPGGFLFVNWEKSGGTAEAL
jgi:hypothetical protein